MSAVAENWLRDELTGDLEFEVSAVPEVRRFDDDAHGVDPWKKVDFVLHWPEERLLWLVEVKDPDNPYAAGDPKRLIEEFQSEKLIHRSLAPKGKDSFLYLLLQDQIPSGTRIHYFVLFACGSLKPGQTARHYLNATKVLRRALGIGGPAGRGWAKRGLFIETCLILSLEQWRAHIGARLRVRRMSTNHEQEQG